MGSPDRYFSWTGFQCYIMLFSLLGIVFSVYFWRKMSISTTLLGTLKSINLVNFAYSSIIPSFGSG
jgi:hypothetical protein